MEADGLGCPRDRDTAACECSRSFAAALAATHAARRRQGRNRFNTGRYEVEALKSMVRRSARRCGCWTGAATTRFQLEREEELNDVGGRSDMRRAVIVAALLSAPVALLGCNDDNNNGTGTG